jgi:hypothetical protein
VGSWGAGELSCGRREWPTFHISGPTPKRPPRHLQHTFELSTASMRCTAVALGVALAATAAAGGAADGHREPGSPHDVPRGYPQGRPDAEFCWAVRAIGYTNNLL